MHKELESREIRRYRNRRLYDTAAGRTITQKELADLVRQGLRVRVIDFATGDDITVSVLSRVARLEVAGWRDQEEGANLYRAIITKGGELGKKAINNVILAGLGALSLTREKAEEIVDTLIKRGEVSRGDRKVAIDDLIAKAEEQAKKFTDTMKQKAGSLRGVKREEYESLKQELESLRQSLGELKEQLAGKQSSSD
jgi:polyhydroxyalkanoate synthesis regulator protein